MKVISTQSPSLARMTSGWIGSVAQADRHLVRCAPGRARPRRCRPGTYILPVRVVVAEAVERDVDVDGLDGVAAARCAPFGHGLPGPAPATASCARGDGEHAAGASTISGDAGAQRARARMRPGSAQRSRPAPTTAAGAPGRPRRSREQQVDRERRQRVAAPCAAAHGRSAIRWWWPKARPCSGLLRPRTALVTAATQGTASSAVPATASRLAPESRRAIRRQSSRPAQTRDEDQRESERRRRAASAGAAAARWSRARLAQGAARSSTARRRRRGRRSATRRLPVVTHMRVGGGRDRSVARSWRSLLSAGARGTGCSATARRPIDSAEVEQDSAAPVAASSKGHPQLRAVTRHHVGERRVDRRVAAAACPAGTLARDEPEGPGVAAWLARRVWRGARTAPASSARRRPVRFVSVTVTSTWSLLGGTRFSIAVRHARERLGRRAGVLRHALHRDDAEARPHVLADRGGPAERERVALQRRRVAPRADHAEGEHPAGHGERDAGGGDRDGDGDEQGLARSDAGNAGQGEPGVRPRQLAWRGGRHRVDRLPGL